MLEEETVGGLVVAVQGNGMVKVEEWGAVDCAFVGSLIPEDDKLGATGGGGKLEARVAALELESMAEH